MSVLRVQLGDVLVGALTMDSNDRTEFAFYEHYREMIDRPVLGQCFEDDLSARQSSRIRLPPFFSNLLPEGPLRALFAKREELRDEQEFLLLSRLGLDLPGAVIVVPEGDIVSDSLTPDSTTEEHVPENPLRFSLTGVQLKFSVLRHDRGATVAVREEHGDWIAKLPDSRYPNVPLNEFSTMMWARTAGINVPQFELVPVEQISGIPDEIRTREPQAFVIRRFDRPASNRRVHMEDFAQVLSVYSREKYRFTNYETIGRIIYNAARQDYEEYLRRLVFVIASANGDAHLKNWSLIYPDTRTPRLSPAYDQVATIQYIREDSLGLNLAGSKRFEDVTIESFARFARKIGADETSTLATVAESVEAIMSGWREIRSDLPIDVDTKTLIEKHWKRVPLLAPLSGT